MNREHYSPLNTSSSQSGSQHGCSAPTGWPTVQGELLCKQGWHKGRETCGENQLLLSLRAILPCRYRSAGMGGMDCSELGGPLAMHIFTMDSKMLLNPVTGGWVGGFPPGNSVSVIFHFQLCFICL